ncbi:MAG: hypothetical protein ABJL67_10405 [Sulfitobacter sp.]
MIKVLIVAVLFNVLIVSNVSDCMSERPEHALLPLNYQNSSFVANLFPHWIKVVSYTDAEKVGSAFLAVNSTDHIPLGVTDVLRIFPREKYFSAYGITLNGFLGLNRHSLPACSDISPIMPMDAVINPNIECGGKTPVFDIVTPLDAKAIWLSKVEFARHFPFEGNPWPLLLPHDLVGSSGGRQGGASGAEGLSDIPDTKGRNTSGYGTDGNRGSQHTSGPVRHFPLGIQIFFGAFLFAICIVSIPVAAQRLLHGDLATAFPFVFFGLIVGGICGLMILIGALVAL